MEKRQTKYIFLICIAILALTACNSEKKEQQKGNSEKKMAEGVTTSKKEAKLAENLTDKSYPFCNSTNLYKMPYQEQAENDGISLIQYDLKGNNRKEITLHEKDAGEKLISVNDQWIYYEYYINSKPAVCRMPITKQDGCDFIVPAAEEILFYPEKRTKEEKARGVETKWVYYDVNYWVTSKYILYFVGLDYKGADDYVDELVRYNLETGDIATKRFDELEDVSDNSMGTIISADESKILYGDGAVNVLDVETMEIQEMVEYEPGSYAISPDGSIFVWGEDNYEYNDETPAWVFLYSLDKDSILASASSFRIKNIICEAEGVDAKNILHISNYVLGCYRKKAYIRYLAEYSQGGSRAAHYGVISMSLSKKGELSFEKELTRKIRRESTENKGQWKRYHKYTKKEKQAAKKTGNTLEKRLKKQCPVAVNFGNPQRVIGNQLFCRSLHVDMNQNHWFCINLDNGDTEEIDREDKRYQWIYCERADGWTGYGGKYISEAFDCLEEDEQTEVIWEQEEKNHSMETLQEKKEKENEETASTIPKQLRYLAEHRYDWLNCIHEAETGSDYDEIPMGETIEECNYGGGLRYMVTDLNQNGQLEIIVTDLAGTGQFTFIWAWEFSEKTHKLKSLIIEDCGPDIGGLDKTTVYYDREKHRYWYYGEDFIHGSAADNWSNICLWSVNQKGKFQSRYYGRMGTEEGDKDLQYYLDDKKVTKKAFKQKKKNMETGMERGKATFQWQQDRQNLLEMRDEELLERLTESWKGFSLSGKTAAKAPAKTSSR